MKTKIVLKLMGYFLIAAAIFSCENNVEEDTTAIVDPISAPTDPGNEIPDGENPDGETPDTPDPTPEPTVISFSADVKPIFDRTCTGCHGGNRFPDLRNINIIQANSGTIRNQVVTRRMPQGGSLSNEAIAIIRDWIDSGALNN